MGFTKKVEEFGGKFFVVSILETRDGGWSYTRSAGGGLELRTQDLKYYLLGSKIKGFMKRRDAEKHLKKELSEEVY